MASFFFWGYFQGWMWIVVGWFLGGNALGYLFQPFLIGEMFYHNLAQIHKGDTQNAGLTRTTNAFSKPVKKNQCFNKGVLGQ